MLLRYFTWRKRVNRDNSPAFFIDLLVLTTVIVLGVTVCGCFSALRKKRRAAGASRLVLIGPEYDTVGYDLAKRAAREAADLHDTLIVCGFAFAPEVDETRLNFGSLTVLKARMNQDLRMGDKLKAPGAGNLFVVFGEPDLRVTQSGDSLIQVEIKGMDIFDFRLAPGVCAREADKPSARPSVALCRCRAP